MTFKMDIIRKLPLIIYSIIRKIRVSESHSNNIPKRNPNYFIDISEYSKQNFKTGIQRVVGKIKENIVAIESINVQFISYSKLGFYSIVSPENTFRNIKKEEKRKIVCSGDIFLGLDFCPFDVPNAFNILSKMKRSGVKLIFLVYDIFPAIYPQYFEDSFVNRFNEWLNCVYLLADCIISTSKYVEEGIKNIYKNKNMNSGIKYFNMKLGSDIIPFQGKGKIHDSINFSNIDFSLRTFLMVGTLEPRKNHYFVLNVFNDIMLSGDVINLIIVGREGWKIEKTKEAMINNIYYGKHLFWFNNTSDEELAYLYMNCSALISASVAEGFGLPISESLSYKLPVIAYKNNVYTELFSDSIIFFENPDELNKILISFNKSLQINRIVANNFSWRESTEQLVKLIKSVID